MKNGFGKRLISWLVCLVMVLALAIGGTMGVAGAEKDSPSQNDANLSDGDGKPQIETIESQPYTGNSIEPPITILWYGQSYSLETLSTKCELVYSNCVNVGTLVMN